MAITYRAYFNAIQETIPDIIKYFNNNKLQELSTNRSPLPYKRTVSPKIIGSKTTYLFSKTCCQRTIGARNTSLHGTLICVVNCDIYHAKCPHSW